jgi:hypothetical protein
MPPLTIWLRAASILSVLACAALLARILAERLASRYLWCARFLLAEGSRTGVLSFLPVTAPLYGWVYILSAPLIWVLAYLVVLELYRLLFEGYPGITSASRLFLHSALAIGTAGSVALLFIGSGPSIQTPSPLDVFFAVERTVNVAVFLFLALMQVFLIRFPVPQSRNLLISSIGCTLYFGSGAGVTLILAATGVQSVTGMLLQVALILFAALALLAWAALLRRSGETEPPPRRRWAPGEPEAIRTQLEDLNRLLGGVDRVFHKKNADK